MSYDVIREDVPRFKKRIGDNVIGGSNNATLVFGTDRETTVDTGYGRIGAPDDGRASGAIHMIVGRSSENVSRDDRAYIYLSMRTDPDDQAGTVGLEGTTRMASGAVVAADSVRIVAREDLKVKVGRCYMTMKVDGTIVIDGDVKIGKAAIERALKGDSTAIWLRTHTHPSAVGPTGVAIQPIPETIFSKRCRIE